MTNNPYAGKSEVNGDDGFAVDPGTDVFGGTTDKTNKDLVNVNDINTDVEQYREPVAVQNDGIDPDEPLPGIHKGIKTDAPDTIDETEVAEAREEAADADADTDADTDADDEASEVPEGTVKDVLAWVGDDAEKAKLALAAEEKGDQRVSLIKQLNEIK